jgi:replication factor C small subunit
MRAVVENWLKDGALPHCLFSGVAGSGKTSLAKLLLRIMDIPEADILFINASRDRNIEAFQDRVTNFVDLYPMGASGMKYILLDEADQMTPYAQRLLRGEMEKYADICRFVMTANYPQKIIPALHSRMQELHFPSLNRDDFTMRLADILFAERVMFEPEVLLTYVEACYPDLRKCINLAQQNSRDALLQPIRKTESGTQDCLPVVIDLFRSGRFYDARKLIVEQVPTEEYEEFYRLLYQNIEVFGATQDHRDDALLIIRDALLNHAVIADPEINLSACLIELCRIGK